MAKRIFQYYPIFVASLLLIFLASQKSVAFGAIATQKSFLQEDISSISSYCEFAKLDLPFESAPTPVDCEVPNENEQEDDSDSNLSAQQENSFNTFDLLCVENCFAKPSSFIQNRSSVPFFVLYHSWKTYLS